MLKINNFLRSIAAPAPRPQAGWSFSTWSRPDHVAIHPIKLGISASIFYHHRCLLSINNRFFLRSFLSCRSGGISSPSHRGRIDGLCCLSPIFASLAPHFYPKQLKAVLGKIPLHLTFPCWPACVGANSVAREAGASLALGSQAGAWEPEGGTQVSQRSRFYDLKGLSLCFLRAL
jgi:hypothetical protein